MDDSKIDTKEVLNFHRWLFLEIDGGEQKELAVSIDEIALALDAVKPLRLVFTVDHSNNFPASQRSKRNSVKSLESEIPLIVGNCSVRLKRRATSPVSGKAFNGLANSAYGKLGQDKPNCSRIA